MAQKISINKRFSKTPSESLSFKNKRRRKVHSSSFIVTRDSHEVDKSPDWRLRNGRQETISDKRCMTNTRECFQQQFPTDKSSNTFKVVEKCHQSGEGVESHANNWHHSIIKAESSLREQTRAHDGTRVEKSKPLRDIVNCRKLLNWTTASSVRKLLPIFILVNMLPFLYAGESKTMSFLFVHANICSSSDTRCRLPAKKYEKKID